MILLWLFASFLNLQHPAFLHCDIATSTERRDTFISPSRFCTKRVPASSRQQLSASKQNEADDHVNVNGQFIETSAIQRRRVISTALVAIFYSVSVNDKSIPNAHAASTEGKQQNIFKTGEALGIEASKARLVEAQASLDYLINNYDEIVKQGGGDGVRRYLGTVGTTSGMYGITKVLKELQEEASDIVNYTETMIEFDSALRAADTAVYSANFVEYSAAKTKPEKYFQDAKTEAVRMQNYLKEMVGELDIK